VAAGSRSRRLGCPACAGHVVRITAAQRGGLRGSVGRARCSAQLAVGVEQPGRGAAADLARVDLARVDRAHVRPWRAGRRVARAGPAEHFAEHFAERASGHFAERNAEHFAEHTGEHSADLCAEHTTRGLERGGAASSSADRCGGRAALEPTAHCPARGLDFGRLSAAARVGDRSSAALSHPFGASRVVAARARGRCCAEGLPPVLHSDEPTRTDWSAPAAARRQPRTCRLAPADADRLPSTGQRGAATPSRSVLQLQSRLPLRPLDAPSDGAPSFGCGWPTSFGRRRPRGGAHRARTTHPRTAPRPE
jgi:hypothetical protein